MSSQRHSHRAPRVPRLGPRSRRAITLITGVGLALGVLPVVVSLVPEARTSPGSATSSAVMASSITNSPSDAAVTPQTSQEAVPLGDGTTLAAWKLVDGVKEFELTVTHRKHQTEPGRVKDGLAINGSIPAPTIRVNEGDRLRITVVNRMRSEGTSIHWHGMDLPNAQDGVPGITQKVIPPQSQHIYEWLAKSTGTHWYHSHMHGDQEGRGVFGSLEIVPAVGDIASDRDYRLIFSDGALGFVINGKSFPATTRLPARIGERVRLRLIGAGPEMVHSIHLHSGFFEVVAQDGHPLPIPYRADTILLGIGQTFDLIFVPTETGAWMLHCHIFSHSETKAGMTGMVTLLDVYEADSLTAPNIPVLGSHAASRKPGE